MHQAVAAFHLSRSAGKALSEEELLNVFARAWSPEGFLSREHEDARYAAGPRGAAALPGGAAGGSRQSRRGRAAVRRSSSTASTIRGRMDRVDRTDDGAVIVDYKSSDVRDQTKADERARDSLQLQVYAMAHQAESGELPHERAAAFPRQRRRRQRRQTERRTGSSERGRNWRRRRRHPRRQVRPQPSPITCGYCPFRQICPSSAA